MVKLDPIQMAFDKLPPSIKNTARDYKEGRDLLIQILSKATHRGEVEILFWLQDNNIPVKDLDKYGRRDLDRD